MRFGKSKAGLFALGRLKTGERNKTEQAYEDLLKAMQISGQILWYSFECIKLRLADNTFYTPDFLVMKASGELEAHEVKGAKAIFMDDARVKIKVAAETFPFKFIVAYPKTKKSGGGWEIEVFE